MNGEDVPHTHQVANCEYSNNFVSTNLTLSM